MSENVRILVCDDDPQVRDATVRILIKAGYQVIEAANGSECLAKAREHRPDIVLVDWVMPDVEGPEVCQNLKADSNLTGIATVLVTGFRTSEDDRAHGLETGADGYLTHPLNKRTFLAHIGALVRMQRAERQLRQKQRLASIGTLVRGVAHEINNPMMGIMGYAQLIRDQVAGQDETLEEFAGEIIHLSDRVVAIVKSLQDLGREPSCLAFQEAELSDILNSTLLLVAKPFLMDGIDVRLSIPDDLPAVRCRTGRIQQAFLALLANARDALNARYPGAAAKKTIAVSAGLTGSDATSGVRITIEDHGDGVPDSSRERVFEPFFTTRDQTQHAGLDLSIALEIAREHGGDLTFESVPAQYTRFHLDLPVHSRD